MQPTAATIDADRAGFLLLPGLIGFIFAFRTCITLLWFQQEPQQATILSAALSLTLLLCAAFSAAGTRPLIDTSCFRTPTIHRLIAFISLACLSLFWTAAPQAAASGYWIAWAADVAAVWFALRYGDPESQSDAIMKGFVLGSCIVATIAWIIPPATDERLGNLDFLHPNAIGFLFSIAIFLGMHLARKSKPWNVAALFLAATLLRTISKTSIIAFIFAFGWWLLMDSTLSRSARIRIGIFTSLIVIAFWGVLESYFDTYTQGTSPETLTGRTLIWALSFEYAIKKPWFGNGFYAHRFVVPQIGSFEPPQAHNELLQQFFSFGVVGVVFFIALYWTFFRQIRRAQTSDIKTLASALFVFALVRGLTDTATFDLSFPLWLMTMLSILLASSNIPPDTLRE